MPNILLARILTQLLRQPSQRKFMGQRLSLLAACCHRRRSKLAAEDRVSTFGSNEEEEYCPDCQHVGTFIQDNIDIIRSRGMVALAPHSSIILGDLSHLRTKVACIGCQSIVSALLEVNEVTESELFSLSARLRFDGNNFFCDVYHGDEEPSDRRGPMLIQIEPHDSKLRVDKVKYGRLMDVNSIDTALIKAWIESCDRLHGSDMATDGNVVPHLEIELHFLYLIDLEQQCLVRVLVDSCSQDAPRYVALSYVWGQVQIPKTTRQNLDQLLQPGALSPERFPSVSGEPLTRTISDAMLLASRLGIRYFWTDCFCIVQDGGAEKAMFINAMASIYSRAYFTIVAGEGTHGDFGIPGVSPQGPPRDVLCRYIKFPGHILATEHINEHNDRGNCDGTIWSKRAWTFQEAFFSGRLLVFNGTMHWFCRNFRSDEWIACEHGGRDWTSNDTPGFVSSVPVWPDMTHFARLVLQYATRDLTYDDDVLAAFAGATTVLARPFRPGFHFGLPELFFDVCLLWEGDRRQPRPLARRKGRSVQLPSWSWVSVKGSLFLDMWTSFAGHFYCSGLPLPDPRVVEPLVEWRKTVQGDGCLKPSDYIFQGRNKDGSLPMGWRLVEEEHEKKGEKYCFSHVSLAGRQFPAPFPILPDEHGGEAGMRVEYSPVLTFTATRAWLKKAETIGRHPWLEYPICRTYNLRDNENRWAGVLSDDGLEDEGFEDASMSGEPAICQLIAISKTRVENWKWAHGTLLEWDLDEHPSADRIEEIYEFYNVLWVSWRVGVAYRRGIGRVSKEVWKELKLEELDVHLG